MAHEEERAAASGSGGSVNELERDCGEYTRIFPSRCFSSGYRLVHEKIS